MELDTESLIMNDDDFCEYSVFLDDLLTEGAYVLSGGEIKNYPRLQNWNVTKEDLHNIIKLQNHVSKFLDENVSNNDYVDRQFRFYKKMIFTRDLMDKIKNFELDKSVEWKQWKKIIKKHSLKEKQGRVRAMAEGDYLPLSYDKIKNDY